MEGSSLSLYDQTPELNCQWDKSLMIVITMMIKEITRVYILTLS